MEACWAMMLMTVFVLKKLFCECCKFVIEVPARERFISMIFMLTEFYAVGPRFMEYTFFL